ncbi:MAG: hypothetical protein ACOZBL_03570 [Patescibacteria group bacterium]
MNQYILDVIQDTIEAKIINDIQFDIHFSVINSQIHIIKTVHTVKQNAVNIRTHLSAVFITHHQSI